MSRDSRSCQANSLVYKRIFLLDRAKSFNLPKCLTRCLSQLTVSLATLLVNFLILEVPLSDVPRVLFLVLLLVPASKGPSSDSGLQRVPESPPSLPFPLRFLPCQPHKPSSLHTACISGLTHNTETDG